MAKGYESLITLYENGGWFDTGSSNPIIPIIASEGLESGLIAHDRSSMVRNTRAHLDESYVVDFEYKPQGFIEIVPRFENVSTILMSHFQIVTEVETGSSFLNTYVPAKLSPEYSGIDAYGTGAYGAPVQDVYSINIKKKVTADSNDHQTFEKGICDKLTFTMEAGEDFKIKADFKFKEWHTNGDGYVFGDADAGTYSNGTLTDWSHGTWAISDIATGGIIDSVSDIFGIVIECSNNLTEKKTPGSLNRQFFNFGNYTVKGNFSTEYDTGFPDGGDSFHNIQNEPFSLVGTIFHTDVDYMVINMPRCLAKPFEMPLGDPEDRLDASIEFEAYEDNGTAPITVTVHTTSATPTLDADIYNAFMGERTLSEFDFADAGMGARTIGDYDYADRDF